MALTKISTDGVKDNAITKAKIPADQIEASELANNAVDTSAIADQAVTLDKLPHGDANNDGKFLRANNGADPSFESLPASGVSVSNNADNRVVTGDGSNLNAEANLTYDENKLVVKSGTHDGGLEVLAANNNQTTRIKIQGKHSDGTERNWFIEVPRGSDILNFFDDSHGSHTQLIDNGNLSIVDGNLAVASGHGIDFSATANSSATGATMSNELLDDYEEGSWTPQIRKYANGSFGTAAGMSDNGTVQRSKYTKIGDMVTVHLHWNGFQISDANYAALGGLPFNTTYNGGGGGTVGYTNAFTNNQNLGILVGADGDNIYFYINNNSWNGWSTSSNRDIYLTVSYFTS